LDWIRNEAFQFPSLGTIIWKTICNDFPPIQSGLTWKVVNGSKVHLGGDPWTGSQNKHILPNQLILHLNKKGYFHLNQIVDSDSINILEKGWKGTRELEIPIH